MYDTFHTLVTGSLSNERILVIGHSFLGDALMTTPFISAIQQQKPAHMGILASGAGLDVYSRLPAPITLHDRSDSNILAQLRFQKYTMAFVLKDDFASAFLAFRCRIRKRFGIAREFSSFLLSRALRPSTLPLHGAARFFPLLGMTHPSKLTTIYTVSEQELSRAKELLSEIHSPFVILAPTTTRPEKNWPVDQCRTFIHLMSLVKKPVLLLGAERDRDHHNLIAADTHCIDCTGLTTIGESAALIKKASCVIACDSGPMHLAAAMDIPLIALFGQTDPARSGPCSSRAIILRATTACSPCLNHHCGNNAPCMASITAENVCEACMQITGL